MLTNTQLKQLIIDNLNSAYSFPLAFLLNQFITRTPAITTDSNLNYRVKAVSGSTTTNITNINDFINALDENQFTLSISTSQYNDNMIGIRILLNNIYCYLSEDLPSDSSLTNTFGVGKFNIAVHLVYMRDTDSNLPLKISNITLQTAQA
jgi:hypothetical protein